MTQPEAPDSEMDAEIPRLTESQDEEIRRHYDLIRRVPGPYRNGLFVYRPKGAL